MKKITKASAVFILAASIAALTTAQVAPISRVNANNENNTVATATTSTEYIATTATVDINHDIENVARHISDRLEPYTLEEETKYLQDKLDSGATMYSMIEKSTGKFIGNTEFFDRKGDDAEWGIAITGSMQDKGFGTEALRRMIDYGFNDLGLERIRLVVFVANEHKVDIFMDIRKEGGAK